MVSDRHNIPGNTWRPGYAQFNQEPTDYPPGKPAHPHSNSGLGTNLPSISSLSSHAHPHDSLPPINAHLSHKSSFSAPSSASAPSATTQIWPGSSTFSSTSAGPPSSFQSQRPVEERNASDNGYQYSQKHEPGIRHASSLPVSLPQQESRYDYLNRSSHNPSNNHPYSSYSTYSQDAGAHGTHVMHGSSQQQASLPPLPQYPNQQHNDFKPAKPLSVPNPNHRQLPAISVSQTQDPSSGRHYAVQAGSVSSMSQGYYAHADSPPPIISNATVTSTTPISAPTASTSSTSSTTGTSGTTGTTGTALSSSSQYSYPPISRDHSPVNQPLPPLPTAVNGQAPSSQSPRREGSKPETKSSTLLPPPELKITITSPPHTEPAQRPNNNIIPTSVPHRNASSTHETPSSNGPSNLLVPTSVPMISPSSPHSPVPPGPGNSLHQGFNSDYLTPEPYYSVNAFPPGTPDSRQQSLSSVSSISSIVSASSVTSAASATDKPESTSPTSSESQPHNVLHSSSTSLAVPPSAMKKPTRARRKEPSCDSCRERKVKCDATGHRPCSVCVVRKIKCQFTRDTNRRRTGSSPAQGSNTSGSAPGSFQEQVENTIANLVSTIDQYKTLLKDAGVNVPPGLDNNAAAAIALASQKLSNSADGNPTSVDSQEPYSPAGYISESAAQNTSSLRNPAVSRDSSPSAYEEAMAEQANSNGQIPPSYYRPFSSQAVIPPLPVHFASAGVTGNPVVSSLIGPKPGERVLQPTPYIARASHREDPLVVFRVLKFLEKYNRGVFPPPPGYTLRPEPISKAVNNENNSDSTQQPVNRYVDKLHVQTHSISRALHVTRQVDLGSLHKYVPRRGLVDVLLFSQREAYSSWMPSTVWAQISINFKKLLWGKPEDNPNCDPSEYLCLHVPEETWTAPFFAALALGVRDNIDPAIRVLDQGDIWIEIAQALIPLGPRAGENLSRDWVIGALLIAIYMSETQRRSMADLWMSNSIQASYRCGIAQGLTKEDQHLWWILFTIDRIYSMRYGRGVFIHEKTLPSTYMFQGLTQKPIDTQNHGEIPKKQSDKHQKNASTSQKSTEKNAGNAQSTNSESDLDLFNIIAHIVCMSDVAARTLMSQKTLSKQTIETFNGYFETFWSLMPEEVLPRQPYPEETLSPGYIDHRPLDARPFFLLMIVKFAQHSLMRLNFSPSAHQSQFLRSAGSCYAGAKQVCRFIYRVLLAFKEEEKQKSPETYSEPLAEAKSYAKLGASLNDMTCSHIWQCLLLIIVYEDYDSTEVLIRVLEESAKSRFSYARYGRHADGFVRELRKSYKQNSSYKPLEDRAVVAIMATDLLSIPHQDWIFSQTDPTDQFDVSPQQSSDNSSSSEKKPRSKAVHSKKKNLQVPAVVTNPTSSSRPTSLNSSFILNQPSGEDGLPSSSQYFDADADDEDEEETSSQDIVDDGVDEATMWKDWDGFRIRIQKLKSMKQSKAEEKDSASNINAPGSSRNTNNQPTLDPKEDGKLKGVSVAQLLGPEMPALHSISSNALRTDDEAQAIGTKRSRPDRGLASKGDNSSVPVTKKSKSSAITGEPTRKRQKGSVSSVIPGSNTNVSKPNSTNAAIIQEPNVLTGQSPIASNVREDSTSSECIDSSPQIASAKANTSDKNNHDAASNDEMTTSSRMAISRIM